MKDCNIAAELFGSYFFYEKVMKTLLRRMGLMSSEPEDQDLGPKASPKVQIAVTCEVRGSGVKYSKKTPPPPLQKKPNKPQNKQKNVLKTPTNKNKRGCSCAFRPPGGAVSQSVFPLRPPPVCLP